ncbi:MAG: hypothetical protein U0264_17245 [Candidatus Kapaibacterium sp.]
MKPKPQNKRYQLSKLTPAQLVVLELFNFPMSESEVDELKKILVEFYHTKLEQSLNNLWDERNMSDSELKKSAAIHRRTPYV